MQDDPASRNAHQHVAPSKRSPHQYPPQSTATDTTLRDVDSQKRLDSFLVHTLTHGLNTSQLQVSPIASHDVDSPAPPVYVRERSLTADNEIVDAIIDTSDKSVCWSIHRPTRGWYLYLKSPSLPSGAAVSITCAKSAEDDASISPLTFSLTTVLHSGSPARTKRCIDGSEAAINQHFAHHDSKHGTPSSISRGLAADTDIAVTSSREINLQGDRGHARKRSAPTPSVRPTTNHRQNRNSLVLNSRIPEEDASLASCSVDERYPKIKVSAPCNPAADADLPYSPMKPHSHSRRDNCIAPDASSNDEQKPSSCTFVLCDGLRRPQRHTSPITHVDQARISFQGQQSWLRWAWSISPSELRSELPWGTNKDFSIFWIDPPGEIGNADSGAVEVLRFHDQSGWFMWNSETRGRLTLQTEAIEALGITTDFWITVALSYIQFLEERDSYEAARHA